jgi:hypothetical protein
MTEMPMVAFSETDPRTGTTTSEQR